MIKPNFRQKPYYTNKEAQNDYITKSWKSEKKIELSYSGLSLLFAFVPKNVNGVSKNCQFLTENENPVHCPHHLECWNTGITE